MMRLDSLAYVHNVSLLLFVLIASCNTAGNSFAVDLAPPCGSPGEHCCPGNRCAPGDCCVVGVCVAVDKTCTPSHSGTCQNGGCEDGNCGGVGQECCKNNNRLGSPPSCTGAFSVCKDGAIDPLQCRPCGAKGQLCCEGKYCTESTVCVDGLCN